jgi:hypothetical protein
VIQVCHLARAMDADPAAQSGAVSTINPIVTALGG